MATQTCCTGNANDNYITSCRTVVSQISFHVLYYFARQNFNIGVSSGAGKLHSSSTQLWSCYCHVQSSDCTFFFFCHLTSCAIIMYTYRPQETRKCQTVSFEFDALCIWNQCAQHEQERCTVLQHNMSPVDCLWLSSLVIQMSSLPGASSEVAHVPVLNISICFLQNLHFYFLWQAAVMNFVH